MSALPIQYTSQQALNWECCAENFQCFIQGNGPYPGHPPAGYIECFKKCQHFAPISDKYPVLVEKALTPQQCAAVLTLFVMPTHAPSTNPGAQMFNTALEMVLQSSKSMAIAIIKQLIEKKQSSNREGYQGITMTSRPAPKLTEHIECQENGLPVPLGTSAPKQARCCCNCKNKLKEPKPTPEIVMKHTPMPEQEPKPEESGDEDADGKYEHKMDEYLNDKEGAQGGWGGKKM
ncbi:hypothetical protein BDQ12DRAFT_725880 [Crucibulum laeve]|uniref:Uncharacterized protein n=1 Tax=Crucibulum laeve TaxID=68775 RepID=A0A5C3LR08_9AGAR|nr:hypothetical protein BDQ12DRAFT_725880 [Crucibulum laeve]